MKSTYQIKEYKDKYDFAYSGDLAEAKRKAEKDLEKEKHNPDVVHWIWVKQKAEKALKSHDSRIRKLQAFISCAERTLAEQSMKFEDSEGNT